MLEIFKDIKRFIEKFGRKDHGESGCVFMTGAVTVTGNFYGFSVGSTKPDSIVVTVDTKPYKLNAADLSASDDIINYCSVGDYVPISFTSITITGSGNLILWYK